MYFNKINSFAEAAARYADTKPIRGNNMDMRPLGKRSRKWERITKLDDDCYALLEYGTGSDTTWDGKPDGTTREEVRMLAPILWERHPDGTETVRIRNEVYRHSQGRYSFLQRAMPIGLGWLNKNGQHYICYKTPHSDEHFMQYLPHSKTIPAHRITRHGAYHSNSFNFTELDDHHYVKLRCAGDCKFSLVSDEHELPKPPRVVVMKDEKAAFKPVANAFWDWMLAVGPLLELPKSGEYSARVEYRKRMREILDAWVNNEPEKLKQIGNRWGDIRLEAPLNREVMANVDHPLRVVLLSALSDSFALQGVTDIDGLRTVRAKFNSWVNKYCGFTKVETN